MAKQKAKLVPLTDHLVDLQQGTKDHLSGSLLFGDATNSFSGTALGGNDTLLGKTGSPEGVVTIYGDTFYMNDASRGGDDSILGADFLTRGANYLYGDARIISNGQGGNDYLKGGDFGNINSIFGDAWSLNGVGGNDVLVGGTESRNTMYGDAQEISALGFGGNDTISAGLGMSQHMFGDSEVLAGKGGSDVLTGSNISGSDLYGDAAVMNSGAVGGNDVLQAGNTTTVNRLLGDAYEATGNVTCGDDVLISGTGFDWMWGDTQVTDGQQITGADRFVFAPGNNADKIYDFESGQDLLDLTAFGFASVQDIQTVLDPAGDLRLQFADGGTVTLIGVTQLQLAHDVLI